jgi:hypothetical protein
MRRAMLGAIVFAIVATGCIAIPRTAAPQPTIPISEPNVVRSPVSVAPLVVTRVLEPTPTLTPISTMMVHRSPTLTIVAPTTTLSNTASPMPSTTSRPPTAAEVASSDTPTPQPPLPQEVTTVIPEASWPYVTSLVVTPDDPPRLYAVIGDKLRSSDDRAQSWQLVDMAGVDKQAKITAVAIDYRDPDTIYLMTSEGIYRRETEQPWAFVHTLKALALAVDLVDPNTLWAGVPYSTEYDAIVLKSSDRGQTWGKADDGMFGGPGAGVSSIIIDPVDPNTFFANVRYAGRFGWPLGTLFRGGQSGHWEQLDIGPQWGSDCLPYGLAFDPGLRRLYVGCDTYYYNERQFTLRHSDNAYAAHSDEIRWGEAPLGWPTQAHLAYGAVRALAADARQPKAVYVAISEYMENEARQTMLISEDDGATWQKLPLP